MCTNENDGAELNPPEQPFHETPSPFEEGHHDFENY